MSNNYIMEIDKKIEEATKNRDWKGIAKLEAEKVNLQEKIKQIEEIAHERKQ